MKIQPNFLKFTSIFLFVLFFAVLNLTAQQTKSEKLLSTESKEQQLSEESVTARLQPLFEPPKQVVEKRPMLRANAAICYKKGATLYLRVLQSDLATGFYLEGASFKQRVPFEVKNGEAIIRHLRNDEEFSVVAIIGSKPQSIATVNTKIDLVNGIKVSNEMYQEIVKWQISTPRIGLFSYLQNVKQVSNFEKTSFLQQFYLGKELLGEEQEDGSVSQSSLTPTSPNGGTDAPEGILGTCNCKLVFNYSQLPIPFKGVSDKTLNTMTWGDNWTENAGANFYQLGMAAGAAKYHQFQSWGKGVGSTEQTFNSVELGQTQTAAFLDYSLVCEDGSNPGLDCGCTKNVDIMYQFDAHLRTAAGNLTPCFLCGSNRGSNAQIEESVALTILNHRTLTAKVVDAVRAKAKTEWNRSINTDFLIEMTNLAAEVGKLFIPSSNGQTITAATIDNIKTALQNVIRTPIHTGSGTSDVFRANMMDSRYFFVLKPNEPTRVALVSLTKAIVGGVTSFQNIAESNTNFALAGIVTESGVNDKFGFCCTPKFCNWVLGGFYGSVVREPDLRQKVGVFLNTYSPWDNAVKDRYTNAVILQEDLGFLQKQICAGGGAPLPGDDKQEFLVSSNWQSTTLGQLIIIKNDKNKKPFTYAIFDVLGRQIASGRGDNGYTTTKISDDGTLSNGIFLLQIEQDGKTETLKMTKTF